MDPSKPTSTTRGMLPGIPHYVDRVSAECIWKEKIDETLNKETRLYQEAREANPGPQPFVMNLANAQRLGDFCALNHRHSRLEILAPKVEKNTPQAIMSAEGDKSSFDYNALMHNLKIPPEKWDIPCTGAQDGPFCLQEIGWLLATRSSARAVEQSKVRKRYPEAEALGICKPPKSQSMPSLAALAADRSLPRAPPDGRLKQLNNNRFYRPKTFCDITLYADNYVSTMHCDPLLGFESDPAWQRGGEPAVPAGAFVMMYPSYQRCSPERRRVAGSLDERCLDEPSQTAIAALLALLGVQVTCFLQGLRQTRPRQAAHDAQLVTFDFDAFSVPEEQQQGMISSLARQMGVAEKLQVSHESELLKCRDPVLLQSVQKAIHGTDLSQHDKISKFFSAAIEAPSLDAFFQPGTDESTALLQMLLKEFYAEGDQVLSAGGMPNPLHDRRTNCIPNLPGRSRATKETKFHAPWKRPISVGKWRRGPRSKLMMVRRQAGP
eukprot:g9562.t2